MQILADQQEQLCTDTGCSLEDLLETMEDKDKWRERERERERESELAAHDDDDDDDKGFIVVLKELFRK